MTKELTDFLPPEHKELDTDLAYVRQNQYQIIENGVKGLEGIMTVAEQSQHPRAYEVLATFLKTLSDLNNDLIKTAEKRRDARGHFSPTTQVTNQNLFVGSTKDLAEMLRNKGKDDK